MNYDHHLNPGSGAEDIQFRQVATTLRPTSLAIVGASDRGEAGWSQIIFENLRDAGFPARVHLINPKRDTIWDHPCNPDFASIGAPVDHALMMVPAPAVVPALTEAASQGVKSATIYSAGFGEGGEAGSEGQERAAALTDLVERYGIRICGPNCMGGLAAHEEMILYPSKRVYGIAKGSVSAVFQSGGTLQFWLEQAAARGLGFRYAVTSGNELDLDLVDYLNYFVEDPETKIITCLIEGVRRPAALMAVAAKAHAAGKPILAVKIGRTEAAQEQAKSHTGALAGDDAVFDAMCRRYGIIRCDDLASLAEIALVFSQGRIPAGNRMGLVTTSGAVKGLALDAAATAQAPWGNLSEPTAVRMRQSISAVSAIDNPLDCGPAAVANGELYSEISAAMLADDDIDMVAFLARAPLREGEPDKPEPFAELAAGTNKPVFAFAHQARPGTDYSIEFQRQAGLPFIHGIPQAVAAMDSLAAYGDCQRRGIQSLSTPQGQVQDLAPEKLKLQLAQAGIATPMEIFAASLEEAVAAADKIGYPVALKLVSPDASHKTEVGGVVVNLADAVAVRDAANDMQDRLKDELTIDGFLIQEMVQGLEVIAGFRQDPQYGPFAVVGLGGVFVEALKDTSLRLLPLTPDDVRDMISELRSAPLFEAFRGQPARDVSALAAAISGLGDLFLDFRPWLSDLEINPIIVGAEGQGVRAVDVRPIRHQQT